MLLSFLFLWACSDTLKEEAPQKIEAQTIQTVVQKKDLPTEEQSSIKIVLYTGSNISQLPLKRPPAHNHPTPLKMAPLHEASYNALKGMIRQHGLLIDNPWALLHALLALGSEAQLPDGRNAIGALFTDHANLQNYGSTTLVQFPTKRVVQGKTILIEPHTDLALKVLTEIGVDPEQKYTVQNQQITFGDLYRASLLDTHLDAKSNTASFQSPNDTPWTIQALSTMISPKTQWSSGGLRMNLEQLTLFLTAVIHQETRFLAEAQKQNRVFQKKKQGIFKYTCGGMHLLQGLAYAHVRGFGSDKSQEVLKEQILLHLCYVEIVDENLKLILGMLWTIILRFDIQDISLERECMHTCFLI